jgi:hypothetical protein
VSDDADGAPVSDAQVGEVTDAEAAVAQVEEVDALESTSRAAGDDSGTQPEPETLQAPVGPSEPGPPVQDERTPPVRAGTPAAPAAPADGGHQDGDGDELIGEQVARPAASSPPRATPARAPARKGGRPSVPSWDDIMFGRKDD